MDLASEAADNKAQFARFASVSWDTPRRVGHTPQIERRNRTKKAKKTSVEFGAFENDCVKIHFSTNQMQIKLNEKNKMGLKTNNHPR